MNKFNRIDLCFLVGLISICVISHGDRLVGAAALGCIVSLACIRRGMPFSMDVWGFRIQAVRSSGRP